VVWVKIDDFENPSKDLTSEYHILLVENSKLVPVPKGYANRLKALELNSEIMIFSNMNLEESVNEKISYPSHWWLDWNEF
jgi:dTDP-4-dehydrorhamnose 3,5-epimerase